MKKIFCLICSFLIFCSPTAPTLPTPDPIGTVTANLTVNSTDYIIYSGIADKACGNYPYINIGFAMTANLNTHFNVTACPSALYPNGSNYYNTGGEVVNMGSCKGLGDVTTIPSSGYSGTASVQEKHGYVLRFRKSYDQSDASLPYTYARFYVLDWLTRSSDHGVIGATIKIQCPFLIGGPDTTSPINDLGTSLVGAEDLDITKDFHVVTGTGQISYFATANFLPGAKITLVFSASGAAQLVHNAAPKGGYAPLWVNRANGTPSSAPSYSGTIEWIYDGTYWRSLALLP